MNKLAYLYAYHNPAEALSIYEANFGKIDLNRLEKVAGIGSAAGNFFHQLGTNPNYQRMALGLGGAALGGLAGGWKGGWKGAVTGAGLGGLGGYYAPSLYGYLKNKTTNPAVSPPQTPTEVPLSQIPVGHTGYNKLWNRNLPARQAWEQRLNPSQSWSAQNIASTVPAETFPGRPIHFQPTVAFSR